MSLPEGFLFSQSSMQVFTTCPRRFELLYIQHVAWPAVQEEPVLECERIGQLGSAFHRLAQQRLLGLPEERLSAAAASNRLSQGELGTWWEAFMNYGDQLPECPGEVASIQKLPEVSLVTEAAFGEYGRFPYRLYAKFDALALVERGMRRTASILDWKTSKGQPTREQLASNWQTRVYPYVLVNAGSQFNQGKPFLPEEVEMIYWFARFPTRPVRFPYSKTQAAKDARLLAGQIEQIEWCCDHGFEAVEDEKKCAKCKFRSLCDMGVRAGAAEQPGETDEIRFDDVLEIEIED